MDDQNIITTNKKSTMKVSVWTLLAILAFAAIGAATAKVQFMYDGSSDTNVQIYGATDKADAISAQQLKHEMITYAVAGAGLGLVVGLISDGFRSRAY